MIRQYGDYGVILSYGDIPTIEEMRKHLKALTSSLRKQAQKEQWDFKMLIAPSKSDRYGIREKRLHVHIIIEGKPARTIADYIENYWKKRHGIADKKKLYDVSGFKSCYVMPQAIYTSEYNYITEDSGNLEQAENIENNTLQPTSTLAPCYIGYKELLQRYRNIPPECIGIWNKTLSRLYDRVRLRSVEMGRRVLENMEGSIPFSPLAYFNCLVLNSS